MKRITPTRWLLLIVAVSCLSLYAYTFIERTTSQACADWSFERSKLAIPIAPLSRGSLIGRIAVPKLHLSAMVREGIDTKTLRLAIGHVPSSPLPGRPGNVGVAGHRDTFFRHLGDLKAGDLIEFSTLQGDFNYAVENWKVVEPGDVAVLASSQEKVLTMVTCYPFHYVGNAPKRFIVRARQIE